MTRDDHDTLYAMADALKGVADLDRAESRCAVYIAADIPSEAIVNYDEAAIKIARDERDKWDTTLSGIPLIPCAALAWFLAIIFAPSHAKAAESVKCASTAWPAWFTFEFSMATMALIVIYLIYVTMWRDAKGRRP